MRRYVICLLLMVFALLALGNVIDIPRDKIAETNEIVYKIYNSHSDGPIWMESHRDINPAEIDKIYPGGKIALPSIEEGEYYLEVLVDGEPFGDRIAFSSREELDGMIMESRGLRREADPEDGGEILETEAIGLTLQGPAGAGISENTLIRNSLGIGYDSGDPLSQLDVRGGHARFWSGSATPGYANIAGDVFIENELEVDGTIYGASWRDASGNDMLFGGTGISVAEDGNGQWTITNTEPSSGGTVTSIATSSPITGGTITTTGTIGIQQEGDIIGGTDITVTGGTNILPGDDAADVTIDFTGSTDDGDWQVSGSDMYSIPSGNVGIGTMTPVAKLEVSGDALINGLTIGLGNGSIISNTALGWEALHNNTTGDFNVAVGRWALASNIDGRRNAALGYQALYSNTSGELNHATGYWALQDNTTGSHNTAAGSYALFENVDGSDNTAVGNNSMVNGSSSNSNTAVGSRSMYHVEGDDNSALGFRSLYNVNSGSSNIGIGYQAGYRLTTGTSNLFLGYQAGNSLSQKVDAVNTMALGANTHTTEDNQFIYGNTSVANHIFQAGNVGIGTSSPASKLHVEGRTANIGQSNSVTFPSGSWGANIAIGATNDITGGRGSTVLGYENSSSGDFGTILGVRNDITSSVSGGHVFGLDNTVSATDAFAIGAQINNSIGNSIQLGWNSSSAPGALVIRDSGNIGINTTSPSSHLDVNGTIRADHYRANDGTDLINAGTDITVTEEADGSWTIDASGGGGTGETYEFTNCSATGRTGPSQAQADATYSGTTLAGEVTISGSGVQQWTVPADGSYTITAAGGAGGTQTYSGGYAGGRGAIITGTFDLTAGETIYIICGQKGEDTRSSVDNAAPGGGGGSFVYRNPTDTYPLIAAGGGGSGARCNSATDNQDANYTTAGNRSGSLVNGGSSGNGGLSNSGGSSYWAGGGSGWLTDGTGGNNTTNYSYSSSYANGGRAPRNGALGGTRYNDGVDEGGDGGFGGGGGGGSDNMGGGGGGGYSGGGGARYDPCGNEPGGGGGSYNAGSSTSEDGYNTGHGYVTIVSGSGGTTASWNYRDSDGDLGAPGQRLEATGTGVDWVDCECGGSGSGCSGDVDIDGSSTTTWTHPFYTYYHDARTQSIYLQSEFGCDGGTINSIQYYVSTTPGQAMNGLTIRLKHTTATTLSSPYDNSGFTTCYTSNTNITSTGWYTFTFSTPFVYNGTDNLMVDIYFDNSSYTSNGSVYSFSDGSTRSLYGYSDSGYGNPSTWTTTPCYTNTNVPRVRFGFSGSLFREIGGSDGFAPADETSGPDLFFADQDRLSSGYAEVDFSREILDKIGDRIPMVVVTPMGPTNQLFITDIDSEGFTVEENDGESNEMFTWFATLKDSDSFDSDERAEEISPVSPELSALKEEFIKDPLKHSHVEWKAKFKEIGGHFMPKDRYEELYIETKQEENLPVNTVNQ